MGEGEHRPGRLGRYEIVGNLASGGMAEVLLARLTGRSGFEKVVAIKRILPRYVEEKSFVDMFLDEARIAAGISHPNVVQYLELGEEGGELFLVMEYLEGESVASLQRRARSRCVDVSFADAVHVVAQAAAGLHAAHELRDGDEVIQGVVHRDVSPHNIFVSYDGTAKVMDFGIAQAAGRITETAAGELKGKFSYMSPEQAAGDPLDRRSDIFSLGIVLYELTTGRRLFRRPSATATLRAVQECVITPPRSLRSDYPESLERVCLKALAAKCDERYPTARAMRADLLRVLPELGPTGLPEEGVRDLLKALFDDRMEEKKEMLRRVRSGSDVTQLPPGEVDRDVEIPSIDVEVALQATVAAKPSAKPPSRRWRWAGLGAILAVSATAAYLGSTPGAPAEPLTAVPVEPEDDPPAETESETIEVVVESDPPGASVLFVGEAEPRGVCPLRVDVPRGAEPQAVVLSLEGYESTEASLVPDRDQRVRLALRPQRPPAVMRSSQRRGPRTGMGGGMSERAFPIL